jgi:hypothetical protein
MLTIGTLKVKGDGRWPASRHEMKTEIRSFARGLGLELDFVARKKMTTSYCRLSTGRATVCEGTGGKLWTMPTVMFYALHEIAHWIQYNEGMFEKYFGRPYYDQWMPPTSKDALRLLLRAERHANWLAQKLGQEIFGATITCPSIYDPGYEKEARAFFIKRNYGIDGP